MDDSFTLEEFKAICKRRKAAITIALVLILSATVLLAVFLPPIYESTATILVEKQEIPTEMITSTASIYAEEQIETISQSVLTGANILSFVEELNLYPDERAKGNERDVVLHIRDGVSVETISTTITDRVKGRELNVAIAFALSVENENPRYAQAIATKLGELFLQENQRIRMARTTETSEFLAAQSERLDTELSDLEIKLADFKRENAQLLPGSLQYTQQLYEKTEQQHVQKQASLRSLNDRRVNLESRLALLGPTDRKSILQNELALARERYSEIHPDVVRLKRSLKEIESGNVYSGSSASRYLSDDAAAAPNSAERLALKSELDSVNASIAAQKIELSHLGEKLKQYEDRMIRAPEVEREYLALTRDYDNALAKNNELKDKQLQAELAGKMEASEKGERFSLLETPALPTEAIKPNRLAIVLIGIILAIGGGVGAALVLEFIDPRIHGSRQLILVTQAPPIGIIPDIDKVHGQQRPAA